MPRMILTGDVNLMNVDDPAVPFARVRDELRAADIVFSNLECCLYEPPSGHAVGERGLLRFTADRWRGTASCRYRRGRHRQQRELWRCRDHRLDRPARRARYSAHRRRRKRRRRTRARSSCERNGIRYGFLQRSSVYWPTNHEAGANSTGIAVIRAHTAYQVPMHKTRPEMPPMNRPGIPPVIITWADPDYLRTFTDDIAALRARADIVVASCHWGLHKEVLGLYARDRPRRDRCRCRYRDRPRAALLAAGRGVSRQGRSATAWAAFRSTPGMAAAGMATGSV